ncbi:hypothetical protein ACT7DB_01090 [Bacillus cereus]
MHVFLVLDTKIPIDWYGIKFFFLLGRGAGKNGFGAWQNFFMLSKQWHKKYSVEWVATSEGKLKLHLMM